MFCDFSAEEILHFLNHHLKEVVFDCNNEEKYLSSIIEDKRFVRKEDILLVGVYGSQVYGLASEQSDFDLFIIVSDVLDEELIKLREMNKQDYSYQVTGLEIHGKQVDFSIYSEKLFRELLMRFILDSFEFYTIALMRREWMVHIDEDFINQISDHVENCVVKSEERALYLRKAISKESDHSFVKGKNKIVKEFKVNKGVKAIFHAMRTVVFGIQIAKYNRVVDFSGANQYWRETEAFYKENIEHQLSGDNSIEYEKIWLSLREEFQPKLRKLQTEFRKAVAKSSDY